MQKVELLIEGSYDFFNDSQLYGQEQFKLFREFETKNLKLISEFYSRLQNGELLKVNIQVLLNSQCYPIYQQIEKKLGKKYSWETFKMDLIENKLEYLFQNNTSSQEYSQSIGPKYYLTNSAVSSSCFFTLTRNFDATGRTLLSLIKSNNTWEYKGPPEKAILYGEFKSHSVEDYQLDNKELNASHLIMYESDNDSEGSGTEFFISKHYGIPYEIRDHNISIRIKHLKRHESDQ